MDEIWDYYVLERMFVLKIVRNILEYSEVEKHPYHNEYKMLIEKISLVTLKDSYLKQLDYLIHVNAPQKLTSGEINNYHIRLGNWAERNIREIIEILHIILLISNQISMTSNDIQLLYNCFKSNSFGRQQNYINMHSNAYAELSKRLMYTEVMVFLKMIDINSNTSGDNNAMTTNQQQQQENIAHTVIDALDNDITRMYHNSEYGPILIAWMLLHIQHTDAINNDQKLLRCRQMGKRALDLDCFRYMLTVINCPMFKVNYF